MSSSPISDIITQFKSKLPSSIFDRLQSELTHIESVHRSDKNLLVHRLNTLTKDHAVLLKEFKQTKLDYGENSFELTELTREFHALRVENESNTRELTELKRELAELQKLRVENVSKTREITELKLELKQVNNSWHEISGENEDLRKKVGIFEGYEKENEVLKVDFGKEMKKNENFVNENGKLVKEKENLVNKMKRVKRLNDCITEAATRKFKEMQERIENLESQFSKLLTLTPPPNNSGEKTFTICNEDETSESLMPDRNVQVPVGTQLVRGATHGEENSASSFSCPPGFINVNSNRLVRCNTMPSSPICISDSDEERESKGRKRKLELGH